MLTGALTMDELMEIVDAVCGTDHRVRPGPDGCTTSSSCLGLPLPQFEAVIGVLERRLYLPLLLEAQRCRSAADLVSFVNIQATSAA